MVWNCGYDDHTLPPVRGAGNQSFHTASIWAALCALVAVHARTSTGTGQLVDVSAHAACNVTTEQGSHFWLVAEKLVTRQTARHAAPRPTEPVIHLDRDGREIHTGFPPTRADDLARLVGWVDDLGLRDEVPTLVLLEMAIEAGGIDLTHLEDDDLVQETYRTVREAIRVVAGTLTARQFFVDGQRRGLAVGVVHAPEDVMVDEHIVARGFPVEVHHPDLGRTVTYPGAPVRFTGTPYRIIRPAPRVGEHQELAGTIWRAPEGNP
jgi:crotonobetainyl-CoA:carnitine CoA-transferase CaiB-like acyl-CoA transferase